MKIFIGKYNSCGVNYQYYEITDRLAHMEECQFVSQPEEADVIIFSSTCACHADRILRMIYYINSILEVKKPGARTYLTGCLAREFLDSNQFSKVTNWLNTHIDCIVPYNKTDDLFKDLFKEQFNQSSSEAGYSFVLNGQGNIFFVHL